MRDTKLDSESSQVAAQLAAANGTLDEVADLTADFTKETKNDRPAIYRAEAAAAHGKALLGLADPTLTSKVVADEVVSDAEALRNQVKEARDASGGNIGPAAENLLASLTRLRQPNALVEEAAKEGATRFKQSLEPRLRGVESEISRIERMLNEVSESSGNESESLVQRMDALKAEIEASETRVQELISDQDSKFTEAQENRRNEFGEALIEAKEALGETRAAIEEDREKAALRLEEIKTEIGDTAAALGGQATAMGHGEESQKQEKLADRWSNITLGILLLAAAIPMVLILTDLDVTAESALAKVAVGLIVATAAGYTAGIARHHRERSAAARRMELEMNSFGPFIAPLDVEDRNDLRSTIIWRFFGPDNEPQEPDGAPRPRRSLMELLHLRRERREPKQAEGE